MNARRRKQMLEKARQSGLLIRDFSEAERLGRLVAMTLKPTGYRNGLAFRPYYLSRMQSEGLKCHVCGKNRPESWYDVTPARGAVPVGNEAKMCCFCIKCYNKFVDDEDNTGWGDMWIDVACWEAVKPRVPFKDLPRLFEEEPWIEWPTYTV